MTDGKSKTTGSFFLETKWILCKNDYYIHIPKKMIHVTNTENMIPHLMGMQYVGRPGWRW